MKKDTLEPLPRGDVVSCDPGKVLTLPAWFPEVGGEMARLLELPPGWNSYHAKPIVPAIARAATRMIARLLRQDTPRAASVPTVHGGVQFEWHVHGIDLEIDFLSPERVELSFENCATGECWDRDLSTSESGPLADAIARLSTAKK